MWLGPRPQPLGLRTDSHLTAPATTLFMRGGVLTPHAGTLALCQVEWGCELGRRGSPLEASQSSGKGYPCSQLSTCSLPQLLHPLINAGKIPLDRGQVLTHSCLHLGQESGIVLKGSGNHLLGSVQVCQELAKLHSLLM